MFLRMGSMMVSWTAKSTACLRNPLTDKTGFLFRVAAFFSIQDCKTKGSAKMWLTLLLLTWYRGTDSNRQALASGGF